MTTAVQNEALELAKVLGQSFTDTKFSEVIGNLTDPEVILIAAKNAQNITSWNFRTLMGNPNADVRTYDVLFSRVNSYSVSEYPDVDAPEVAVRYTLAKDTTLGAFIHFASRRDIVTHDELLMKVRQQADFTAVTAVHIVGLYIDEYGYDEGIEAEAWDALTRQSEHLYTVDYHRRSIAASDYTNLVLESVLSDTEDAAKLDQAVLTGLALGLEKNPNLTAEQAKKHILNAHRVRTSSFHYKLGVDIWESILDTFRNSPSESVQTLIYSLDNADDLVLIEGSAPADVVDMYKHAKSQARNERRRVFTWSNHAMEVERYETLVDSYEDNYRNLIKRHQRAMEKANNGKGTQDAVTALETRLTNLRRYTHFREQRKVLDGRD
jgi:hypothetical protein